MPLVFRGLGPVCLELQLHDARSLESNGLLQHLFAIHRATVGIDLHHRMRKVDSRHHARQVLIKNADLPCRIVFLHVSGFVLGPSHPTAHASRSTGIRPQLAHHLMRPEALSRSVAAPAPPAIRLRACTRRTARGIRPAPSYPCRCRPDCRTELQSVCSLSPGDWPR